jgi:mannitol-1-phosphate/altronate dehydrogenase
MAKNMHIGGNFQLAEQARMFQDRGVAYVRPRSKDVVERINKFGNRYNVVVMNPDGNFDVEEVQLEDSLCINPNDTDGRERFFDYAKSEELEIISVGVSDGMLKDRMSADIWTDLAMFLHAMYSHQGDEREISFLESDNAFNNGQLLRRNILNAIAGAPYESYGHDARFIHWFETHVYFHNCVVDRMVMGSPGPAAQPIIDTLGLDSGQLTIFTEPAPRIAHKLVVEDPTGRLSYSIASVPESERAMAIKASVFPYAVVKYEGCNYFHTMQVHWGYIGDILDVYSNLQDEGLRSHIEDACEAKAQIVSEYDYFKDLDIDIRGIINEFGERCDNPYLGHRNEFIVRNGTGKIIERVKGSLVATNGEIDRGMYGTIASIIREKTPVRTEGGGDDIKYYGRKDSGEDYLIEDTDNFIMETMNGVDAETGRDVVSKKVAAILYHLGLAGLSPKLENGVTEILCDLYKRKALAVLADRYG